MYDIEREQPLWMERGVPLGFDFFTGNTHVGAGLYYFGISNEIGGNAACHHHHDLYTTS